MTCLIKQLPFYLVAAAALALVSHRSLAAEQSTAQEAKPAIALGAPFADHAVLQRQMPVPVWGWSEPGDEVTVRFAGQQKSAVTGKDGKWIARLDPLEASFEPREMVVTAGAGRTVTLKNILVGEVWLASGQSNMQWAAARSTSGPIARQLAAETKDKVAPIREFEVTSVAAQLFPIERATGAWKDGDYNEQSAIAFAFAEKLYRELNVPVGILNCSWSATRIEAWVPRQGYATAEDDYGKAIHHKCLQSDPRTPEHEQAWSAFYHSLERQIAEAEARIAAGGRATAVSAPVPGNMNGNRDASWMFNGRMNPVVPYAIRGAIWNQGWHNRNDGLTYYQNLHNLVRGWRLVWDKPHLPVYFHQFYCPDETDEPGIDPTAEMRLGTWMARDIPHTGMASQIDIGGAIHYHSKAVPGQRLALHALKNQYGKDVVADGPMYRSSRVEGDKVIIQFDHADGGLVVAEKPDEPRVIDNGEAQVKLFWLAGEDRVWHRAAFTIQGDQVIVRSTAVAKPRGVSYGSGGIGFQHCLSNRALLPMTPFIVYDGQMVTSRIWPDKELKLAGGQAPRAPKADDDDADGENAPAGDLVYRYRKMPLLSVQFRDAAVFQADKPVTIWGSTRNYGEWQDEPEPGDCKVHLEFGEVKQVIDVTPDMAEWRVTLPPMEAGPKAYTLKVGFTIDGQLAHERVISGIVFGDVWYVAAPALTHKAQWKLPRVEPSGQIVRMMQNNSKRDRHTRPSRFSVCVSRTPNNRHAAHWSDADGLAAAIGHSLAARSHRPVGVIFMQNRQPAPLSSWIAAEFLKEAPTLMEDYKTVGSQYPGNPDYLANVRRYLAQWKTYWAEHVPEMIATKAVPDGSAWGQMPSPDPEIGDSQATRTYNALVDSFAPTRLSGIVFLAGESMVADDAGAAFGPELAVVAQCLRSRLAGGDDVTFICTVPDKTLAPKVTPPVMTGRSKVLQIADWTDLGALIDALQD